MNDFVLRGFCQKCDESWIYPWPDARFCPKGGQCEWIGFLFPNQMKIILFSKKFQESDYRKLDAIGLVCILEEEPFLVAKILSEDSRARESVNKNSGAEK